MKILRKLILFFSNYLPLEIWTLKIFIHDIGHFQSIKTDVLQIFSFITGDKTEFLSPMMFSN